MGQIKLKHISLVTSEEVDLAKVMVEIFGYKNTWWNKRFRFRKEAVKAYEVVNAVRAIDISKLSLDKCSIKYPSDVDSLTFQARLEIDNLKGSAGTIEELITSTISLACYQSHHKVKFDSDSRLYKEFKEHVSNQPLTEMMGLYNDLSKAIEDSDTLWSKLFQQMSVMDADYEEANGSAVLGRFNLLKTIKGLQQDFRVSYDEAFLLQYRLVQSNNLLGASQNWVQDRMTQVKEKRMRARQR